MTTTADQINEQVQRLKTEPISRRELDRQQALFTRQQEDKILKFYAERARAEEIRRIQSQHFNGSFCNLWDQVMTLNKAQTEFYLTVNDPSVPDVVRFEASRAGLEALDKFNQERDDKDLSFDPDGGLRAYAKAFRTYAALRPKKPLDTQLTLRYTLPCQMDDTQQETPQ